MDKEKTKADLEKCDHPLSNGLLTAIRDITDVKADVKEITMSVSKIHKVITGDPEFHTNGIIQNQINNQEAALARHREVMDKISALENTRISNLEQNITALEKTIAIIKTWGAVALLLWGFLSALFVEYVKTFFK